MFSYIRKIKTPSGNEFILYGRESNIHIDLSVEYVHGDTDVPKDDGDLYHRRLEHPTTEADCVKRMDEIEAQILKGENISKTITFEKDGKTSVITVEYDGSGVKVSVSSDDPKYGSKAESMDEPKNIMFDKGLERADEIKTAINDSADSI